MTDAEADPDVAPQGGDPGDRTPAPAPPSNQAEADPEAEAEAEGPSYSERLRAQYVRGRARYDSEYSHLQARRSDSTAVDAVFRVAEADEARAGGLIAGGTAFRIFVMLIPFAFVFVTAFAALGKTFDSSDPQALADAFGIVGLAGLSVEAATDLSTVELIVTLVGGSLAVIYATWTMIRAMRIVHGLAWDALPLPPLARPWLPPLWTVAATTGLLLLSAFGSTVGEEVGFVEELTLRLLGFALFVAVWVLVSWWLPHAPGTTWRAFLPGAALLGVGAEILQLVTIYFFGPYLENKTNTYGALGASLVLLLWAYFLGRLILAAAFLNATRWYQAHPMDVADPV